MADVPQIHSPRTLRALAITRLARALGVQLGGDLEETDAINACADAAERGARSFGHRDADDIKHMRDVVRMYGGPHTLAAFHRIVSRRAPDPLASVVDSLEDPDYRCRDDAEPIAPPGEITIRVSLTRRARMRLTRNAAALGVSRDEVIRDIIEAALR